MLTLITGAPGAGKTAALVSLLREFTTSKRVDNGVSVASRPIYCDGIPDLAIAHEPLNVQRWHETVPDGSIIVIDECQRHWRPGSSGARIPPEIAALETHRHRGIDVYVLTQHPSLLHSNVRRLVGRHIHLRDLGILGRWWYEWPEASNTETFRTAPVKRRYTLDKKAFSLYKSASLHVKPVRSIPRSLVFGLLGVAALTYLVPSLYFRFTAKLEPKAPAAAASAPKLAAGGHASPGGAGPEVASASGVSTAVRPATTEAPKAPEEPLAAGCMSLGSRCECWAADGRRMLVSRELCVVSAGSFSGVVPLVLTGSRAPGVGAVGPDGVASAPVRVASPTLAVSSAASPIVGPIADGRPMPAWDSPLGLISAAGGLGARPQ